MTKVYFLVKFEGKIYSNISISFSLGSGIVDWYLVVSSDWLWFWNIKYSPFSVISQPRPSPDYTLRYIPSNFHNLLFSEPGMRWKIEDKSKRSLILTASSCIFFNFKAELKLCWQKYIIPKYFSFIPLLLPPTNNSAPLWCMKGGEGELFSNF